MRRLHVTIVLLGGLVLLGAVVIATSFVPAAAPDDGTAADPAGGTAVPTQDSERTERPPTVRILDTDGQAVMNPFVDRNWTETASYVHVGRDEPNAEEPVAVLVLNDGAERPLSVVARHLPTNTTLYDGTPTLAPAEALVFVFHEPSAYSVDVAADTERGLVTLEREEFDCNERTIGVAVDRDGTTERGQTATMLGCETP